MKNKPYNTAGRRYVLEYMAENSHRQFTADQLFSALEAQGLQVGKSSVYRILQKLVNEGAVRKFKESELASSAFQYIGSDKDCCSHLHLKCTNCGMLVHLECQNSTELLTHIYNEHGFFVDSKRSLLYGKCRDCQKNISEKN